MSGEDDLLERATRALRAAPPPTEDELRAARARLLAAHVKAGRKSPARTLRWVLPLAAVLVAGSALAATTGQIERVVRAVASLLQPERAEPRKAKKQRLPARPPEPLEAPVPPLPTPPEPEPAPAPQESPLSADAEAERAPRRPARRRSSAADAPARAESAPAEPAPAEPANAEAPQSEPEEVEAPSAPTPVPSEDLARYRQAHTAHFRQRDFRAALRAWDAYLSEFPQGVFAIEARYNRAICLVRLGRNEEARRALQPFARGQVGRAYRRAEATKLLEALE